jgi:hypothetical protein
VPDLSREPPKPGEPPRRSGPGLPTRFPNVYAELQETPFKDIEVKSGKQTLDFPLKSSAK